MKEAGTAAHPWALSQLAWLCQGAGDVDGRTPIVVAGSCAGGKLVAVVVQKAQQHGGQPASALNVIMKTVAFLIFQINACAMHASQLGKCGKFYGGYAR